MKIVLIAILFLIVLILIIYAYYGGFKKIEFVVSKQGGEILVYENLTGDYKQSPIIMDKVYIMIKLKHIGDLAFIMTILKKLKKVNCVQKLAVFWRKRIV